MEPTIDHTLFLALNFDGGPFWDNFFRLASGKLTWVPLYLVVLWLMVRRVGWRNMLIAFGFIVLTVVLADQIANFFKHFTPRLRPTHNPDLTGLVHTVGGYRGGLYGTVSAHAATVFAIALFSASIIRSCLYFVLIILWAFIVSYSRIYLGVHFPLDILWGTLTGTILALIALRIYYRTIQFIDRYPKS